MKKFIVAVVIIGAFILYSFVYARSNTPSLLPDTTTRPSSSNSSTPTSGDGSTNPATTPTSGALYKDGSYTGSVADAFWGNIQVKAIIQNGRISDVQFLQYPNERNRSVMINQRADPQLTSEAIQVQSAQVDIITGATDSSEAFIQSLSDALSQAKA